MNKDNIIRENILPKLQPIVFLVPTTEEALFAYLYFVRRFKFGIPSDLRHLLLMRNCYIPLFSSGQHRNHYYNFQSLCFTQLIPNASWTDVVQSELLPSLLGLAIIWPNINNCIHDYVDKIIESGDMNMFNYLVEVGLPEYIIRELKNDSSIVSIASKMCKFSSQCNEKFQPFLWNYALQSIDCATDISPMWFHLSKDSNMSKI